jgi:hypothetical protein
MICIHEDSGKYKIIHSEFSKNKNPPKSLWEMHLLSTPFREYRNPKELFYF